MFWGSPQKKPMVSGTGLTSRWQWHIPMLQSALQCYNLLIYKSLPTQRGRTSYRIGNQAAVRGTYASVGTVILTSAETNFHLDRAYIQWHFDLCIQEWTNEGIIYGNCSRICELYIAAAYRYSSIVSDSTPLMNTPCLMDINTLLLTSGTY
jgi:hypothetical protein